MAFIVGLGLSGCEKEKVNNTIPTSSQNEELNSSKCTIVVFYFTWDEWGRKKRIVMEVVYVISDWNVLKFTLASQNHL